MVDFEMPVCKLYFLLLSANNAQEKENKRRKSCCPLAFQSLQSMQYLDLYEREPSDLLPHACEDKLFLHLEK
jgi:hypothetical protein